MSDRGAIDMSDRREKKKKAEVVKPAHDTHKIKHDNGVEQTLCGAKKIDGFGVLGSYTAALVDCKECLELMREKPRSSGSDRIGQLTAKLQMHGPNLTGARGGKSELTPHDVAAVFGCIKGDAAKAIASYWYSVGNDRHGAVDALYLILAHEQTRQDRELLAARERYRLDPYNEILARREAFIDRVNWPEMARKGGTDYPMHERIRDIARIVIDEKSGRIKTHACIAKCLGVAQSKATENWVKIVSFARLGVSNALESAEKDILDALM
jgi:hypothetical protein